MLEDYSTPHGKRYFVNLSWVSPWCEQKLGIEAQAMCIACNDTSVIVINFRKSKTHAITDTYCIQNWSLWPRFLFGDQRPWFVIRWHWLHTHTFLTFLARSPLRWSHVPVMRLRTIFVVLKSGTNFDLCTSTQYFIMVVIGRSRSKRLALLFTFSFGRFPLFFSSLFCSPDPLYVLLGLSASRSYQFHSFHVDQAGQPCYPNVLSAHQVAHSVHVPVLPTTLFWSSSAARDLERRPAPPSGPSPNPPSELEGLRLRLMHTFPLHEGQNAPL